MRPLRLLLALSSSLFAILALSYLAASGTQTIHTTDHGSNGFRPFFTWHTPSSLFPPTAIISLTDDNSTFFLARPANFGPLIPSKGLSGPLWIGSGFGDDHLRRGGVASAEGELGCSDVPGWNDGDYGVATGGTSDTNDKSRNPKSPASGAQSADGKAAKVKRTSPAGASDDEDLQDTILAEDDGTDDHLHHPLMASGDVKANSKKQDWRKKKAHADIQSIQESAEIAGKVVLLSRGGCGFLEKTKWVQRRGGTALIVGDDIRGGPLVTMYARGDTSNVTIPSVFTSHTTAHLLSSLIPSGGLFEDLTSEELSKLGLAVTEKTTQGQASYDGRGRASHGGNKNAAIDSSSKTKAARKPKDEHAKATLKDTEKDGNKKGWLRSLFSSSDDTTRTDSRRPPSSGNIDWVLQEDFVEEEPAKIKAVKQTTTTAKANQPTKAAKKPQGDGFVIGVQDWRDPDLVESTPVKTDAGREAAGKLSADQSAHSVPKADSITPGSGDYSQSGFRKPTKEQSGDGNTKAGGSDDKDVEDVGWLNKLSWSDAEPSNMQTDADRLPKKPSKSTVTALEETGRKHDEDQDKDKRPEFHQGLWVTLQPTSMSSSPFFDTLLVLVVSPLVTLTVVYALLLLRSRIRRRRWRAPKSVVERLPVRTYQTMNSSSDGSRSPLSAPPSPNSSTPLLHSGARTISQTRQRPRSRTAGEVPIAGSSLGQSVTPTSSLDQVQEKREAGLAEWRRRYGGKQKECVVCLEEYVDGVSRVMSLPCGHEFHAECITPWLTTRRRTCPICKGDVVRSLARSTASPSPLSSNVQQFHGNDDDDERLDEVQEQAAGTRNDDPIAAEPISREDEAFEDLERGIPVDRTR